MSQTINWRPDPTLDPAARLLAQQQNLPLNLAQLLTQRPQIPLTELHADLTKLSPPDTLNDMDRGVGRIKQAIADQELIVVYGDYDVDGITSTLIMTSAIKSLGGRVYPYLPDRFIDGYGPNQATYKRLIGAGAQLIVTVDNGIAGQKAIRYAVSVGVDVVVTDHHQLGKTLPRGASALIHPQLSLAHPFKGLAGCGVAFKVAWALLDRLPIEYLDLVALGTVADVMPLIDDNRRLVTGGLSMIHQQPRPGLAAILDLAATPAFLTTTETIGFQIGPRLNAAGRLANAGTAFDLLATTNSNKINERLNAVETLNHQRKELVKKAVDLALDPTEELKQRWQMQNPTLILTDEQNRWRAGILGLIAGQVAEFYNKPTLALTTKNGFRMAGSGRSVTGFNLYTALNSHRELFSTFGGHAAAIGLSLPIANVPSARIALNQAVIDQNWHLQATDQAADLLYPCNGDPMTMLKEIWPLSPYGEANPEPIWVMIAPEIHHPRLMGADEQTLGADIIINTQTYSLIGFKLAAKLPILQGSCKLYVTLSLHHFRGKTDVQFRLLDAVKL